MNQYDKFNRCLRTVFVAVYTCLPVFCLSQPAFITSEPFIRQKFEMAIAQKDTFPHFVYPVFDSTKLKQNLCHSNTCKRKDARYFEVLAIPHLGAGGLLPEQDLKWQAGAGLVAQFVSEKLVVSIAGMWVWDNASLPVFADSAGLYPGWNINYSRHPNRFTATDFRILYKPVSWFTAEAGYSKHFLGYGIQSLWLSDNAAPYPFVKLSANVWKFEYQQLYTMLRDFNYPVSYQLQNKYASTHFLIYRPTKHFDIQLFESVVWRSSDSLVYRNFDVNYINPVIFFRPVEYQLSDPSPDNVLMGAGCSYRFHNNFMLYSQLMMDEFNLNELRSGKQWWANKQALQAGLKWYFPFGNKNWMVQTEYNYVRPYTYSHDNSLKNYGHQGLPLAHPEGANFRELIIKTTWQKGKLGIMASWSYISTGTDTSAASFGKDIYKPYTLRVSDYHIKTSQGNSLKLMFFYIETDYRLSDHNNISLFSRYEWSYGRQKHVNEFTHFVFLGITGRFFPMKYPR